MSVRSTLQPEQSQMTYGDKSWAQRCMSQCLACTPAADHSVLPRCMRVKDMHRCPGHAVVVDLISKKQSLSWLAPRISLCYWRLLP